MPPPAKRLKPFARNGGHQDSYISHALPSPSQNNGSDTEPDDDNEARAQFYLNKMTDIPSENPVTVFGRGVDVWTSRSGTIYADVNDRVKQKQREKELWGGDKRRKAEAEMEQQKAQQMAIYQKKQQTATLQKQRKTGVVPPHTSAPSTSALRPSAPRPSAPSASAPSTPAPNPPLATTQTTPLKTPTYADTTITYPGRPVNIFAWAATHQHAHAASCPNPDPPSAILPPPPISQPASPLPTITQVPLGHRTRHPGDSQFHHSSAGIDPLGAHNRPLAGLPSRGRAGRAAGKGRGRVIVSGSFGSFDGAVGRFDERAYRMGPGALKRAGGGGEEKEKGEGEGDVSKGLDVFKGKPWLKR
ncbi:hypothetical protein ACN47E_000868 [Coniothyrium glycines]